MKFRRHNSILVLAVLLLAGFCCDTSFAQDPIENGQSSLANFPWYDAENDSLQPMEVAAPPEARTKDRNSLSKGARKTPLAGGMGGAPSALAGLSILTWGLIALFIAGVVAALLWAFLRVDNSGPAEDTDYVRGKSMEERIKELPFELEKWTGDFQQLARQAYQSGDYKTAITLLFSHVLLRLDKASLIRLRKGKTNRQYLGELRSHRNLTNYYQRVMVPFEDAFFGDHELGRERFEDCWNGLENFETNVTQAVQVTG